MLRPSPSGTTNNRLLLQLDEAERVNVLDQSILMPMQTGQLLEEIDQPVQYVYFPDSGLSSLVSVLGDGKMTEAACIGIDGFIGSSLLLRSRHRTTRMIWQVPGAAHAIPAGVFSGLLRQGDLSQVLHVAVQDLIHQLVQVVGCNRTHPLEQRCARWLLMTDDRMPGSTFELTHEFLAAMLGTDRPHVTTAAGALQHAGLITYHRGVVSILDRPGLEQMVCECYSVLAEMFPGVDRHGDPSPVSAEPPIERRERWLGQVLEH
jgi:CRP-like cAMP-binding protein